MKDALRVFSVFSIGRHTGIWPMSPQALARIELLRIAALLEKAEDTAKLERHEELLVDMAVSLTGRVKPPSIERYERWCVDLEQTLNLKELAGEEIRSGGASDHG